MCQAWQAGAHAQPQRQAASQLVVVQPEQLEPAKLLPAGGQAAPAERSARGVSGFDTHDLPEVASRVAGSACAAIHWGAMQSHLS